MDTIRVARLELQMRKLWIAVVVMSCVAITAGTIAIIFAVRRPTSLAIGGMRLDANGLSFVDGEDFTEVRADGLHAKSPNAFSYFGAYGWYARTRAEPQLTVQSWVSGDRGMVSLDGADTTIQLTISASDAPNVLIRSGTNARTIDAR